METTDHNLIKEYFPNLPYISLVYELRKTLSGCKTILDLGCGTLSPVRFVKAERFGVDGHEPSIIEARARHTHHNYKLINARDIKKYFQRRSFDAVVAIDLIEHLTKDQGLTLLKDMEEIAKQRVVVFTPNGFMPQKSSNNDLQEHLCGWETEQMKRLGYSVVGMYGYKPLRGEYHNLRFRPKLLWGIISELSNYLYTRRHSEKSAALLCTKNINGFRRIP